MSNVLGRPLWYELMTTDKSAAEKFYAAVVGWTPKAYDGGPMPYTMFERKKDTPVAGVMDLPPGVQAPPHWMMYVGVPKLEDAVAKVEKLGGKAVSPVIEVPNIGRMRTMADPQGAYFSLYEPANDPGPEAAPEVGDTSWHELMTTDATRADKFYSDLFGWKGHGDHDMGPMGNYHMFGRDWPLGGMMNKPQEMAQVPPNWGYYFRVPDVHKGAEKVKANGGQVVNGPIEVPGGDWVVNCTDPQGAYFSLHHKK